jgi:hypothetical protein
MGYLMPWRIKTLTPRFYCCTLTGGPRQFAGIWFVCAPRQKYDVAQARQNHSCFSFEERASVEAQIFVADINLN